MRTSNLFVLFFAAVTPTLAACGGSHPSGSGGSGAGGSGGATAASSSSSSESTSSTSSSSSSSSTGSASTSSSSTGSSSTGSSTGSTSTSSSTGSSSTGSSSSSTGSTSTSTSTSSSTGSSSGFAAGAPVVLYTDILSGPTTGGENGKGIYLSIFGKGFGTTGLGTTVRVYIGTAEVAVYRSLGPSKGRSDVEQITVQVGALGNATPGVAQPIRVSVNGQDSNTDHAFTINPGKIYFVDNVTGADATGAAGDPSHPYRYVQTPALTTGGAWPKVQPGDFIVMRGKGTAWTDVGFESYFMRYRDKSGSAPTGAAGTGPITLMGYPGEDVFIHGTIAGGMTGGCISAINGETYPTAGKWAVVTNLRIDCEGYDGPISQEIHGDHWRVVNNQLSATTAPTSGPNIPRMAGITGNGTGSVWLGNHIHDIQGSPQECHGIYIDGDGSYEIAYNWIHDIKSGNGFQAYANGGNGSTVINDVNLHHNLIHDVSKHLFNIADGSRSGFVIWDNVAYNGADAAVRFNTTDLVGLKLWNNTFFNVDSVGSSIYGALMNDWNLPAGAIDVENNIFVPHPGMPYNGGSNGITAGCGTVAHNLWFGGSGSIPLDTSPVKADPKFVASGSDFHLGSGSAAIGAGVASVSSLVTTDYDVAPRSAPFDLGAYQAP